MFTRIPLLFCLLLSTICLSQEYPGFGTEVNLNVSELISKASKASTKSKVQIDIPMPSGDLEAVSFSAYKITEEQPLDIRTYSGTSSKSGAHVRMTITPSGLNLVLHYASGYYFIDPIDASTGRYLMYNINDGPQGMCGTTQDKFEIKKITENIKKSVAPFPVGAQLRKYRMAAAGTTEMTAAMGSQTAARDKIVAIMAAANLIYNLEASVQFDLIAKTTNMSIVFNGADPFTPDPNFANAGNAQTGFNTMNTNGTLLYSEYDIGHVFHINNGGGTGASGQAGPLPCITTGKARAWTEFTAGAIPAQFVGLVAGLFVHEVGHQFQAWHTYNATGGNNNFDNWSFCTGGWDPSTAVEPGSGTTLMGYGGNCSNAGHPTNPSYVLAAPNNEQYFHTKSLEQIYNTVAASGCITMTATGNTPPVATAGADLTIPIGTPFALTGSATDANVGNALSYVWDQYDIATAAGDRGALGSAINGTGGYPAVSSTASAPLFRSRMSTTTPTRNFPDMQYILDGTNNPPDNVGEDLPQVGRNMSFRFTVRDNVANGGGVDSDDLEITVDGTKGPLTVTSHGATSALAVGMTYPVTWTVNSTDDISPNVKISLSTDNGVTFPTVLLASTPNDGNQSVTIPGGVPSSTSARIKVSSTHHASHEFFDINNANLITGDCTTYNSADTPKAIPDPGNTTSTIVVADVGTIEDVDVVLNGTHTWISDLSFSLRHPDGTTVNIINSGKCNDQDNFNVTLDDDAATMIVCAGYNTGGIYKPDNPLSVLNGKSTNGNWVLTVNDFTSPDPGTLTSWSLAICKAGLPCSITGAAASAVSCSGNNATFNMSFTVANGSGNYQVVNATNTVVGSGTSSPIAVTVPGPTVAGNQNFRVRDAANNSCISTAVTVSIPQCPPPCSITGVTAGTATCSGQDATFNVTAFTPTNGSGSYQIINASSQVVGTGAAANISCTVPGPTAAGNQNFRVRDANNLTCISPTVTVNIPRCILPCNTTPGGNITGNVSGVDLRSKTFLTSNANVDVNAGNVTFQARDHIELNANFQVNTNGIFEAKIGDCDDGN